VGRRPARQKMAALREDHMKRTEPRHHPGRRHKYHLHKSGYTWGSVSFLFLSLFTKADYLQTPMRNAGNRVAADQDIIIQITYFLFLWRRCESLLRSMVLAEM